MAVGGLGGADYSGRIRVHGINRTLVSLLNLLICTSLLRGGWLRSNWLRNRVGRFENHLVGVSRAGDNPRVIRRLQRLSRPTRLVRVLQLANPRHLSGLLHRLCRLRGLHWLCRLAITLGYLAVTLRYLTVSLHRPAVTLRGLSSAWRNAWLCLCLCLRLWLGEVGV